MTPLNKVLLVLVVGALIFGVTKTYQESKYAVDETKNTDLNSDGDVDLQDVSILLSDIDATSTPTTTPNASTTVTQ